MVWSNLHVLVLCDNHASIVIRAEVYHPTHSLSQALIFVSAPKDRLPGWIRGWHLYSTDRLLGTSANLLACHILAVLDLCTHRKLPFYRPPVYIIHGTEGYQSSL